MKKSFLLLMLLHPIAFAKDPAFAPLKEDPALPRVLLVGDSISIGYTLGVRDALAGKANVLRIPTNAGHTGMGLAGLPKWLDQKNGKWDVIHFNWGLWDLCYRNPESKTQGHRDKVNGKQTFTPDEYAANLEKILRILKGTGARLVFATTTPVPEGEAGRVVGDDVVFNTKAVEVMGRYGVSVNDLHALMAPQLYKYIVAKGNVHYKPEGSELLAAQVAKAIEEALGK
jgi:hypothetical protein